jgi:hypothetical protein
MRLLEKITIPLRENEGAPVVAPKEEDEAEQMLEMMQQ